MVDFQSRDTRRSHDADEGETADDQSPDADTHERPSTRETAGEAVGPGGRAGFAVVSVGSDRAFDRDPPGDAVVEEIDGAGGHVATREVIDASYDGVQSDIETLVDRRDVLAVVTTGGAGIGPDDVTIEAVEPLLDRRMPGFGELLRQHCFENAGSAVIRTRATAGTIEGVPVFCLPGEPGLTRWAVRELVVPEAETIAELARPPAK